MAMEDKISPGPGPACILPLHTIYIATNRTHGRSRIKVVSLITHGIGVDCPRGFDYEITFQGLRAT